MAEYLISARLRIVLLSKGITSGAYYTGIYAGIHERLCGLAKKNLAASVNLHKLQLKEIEAVADDILEI